MIISPLALFIPGLFALKLDRKRQFDSASFCHLARAVWYARFQLVQFIFRDPIQFLYLHFPFLHECNLLSQLLQPNWQRRFFGDLQGAERIQLDPLIF